jgi:hypothetical protein
MKLGVRFFLLMKVKLEVKDCITYLHAEEEILVFEKDQQKFHIPKYFYVCCYHIIARRPWRIIDAFSPVVAFKLFAQIIKLAVTFNE